MADDSKGGRIAIKFGASSSSKPKTPASSLGKRPRTTTSSHAFGGGADSDSEDDRHRGKHEAITGFGADGAETERKKKEAAEAATAKKDYVIARQPNRDWRDEIKEQRNARRGKNLLPAEAQAAAAAAQNGGKNGSTTVDTAPADQDSGIQWGLTVKEKKAADNDDTETPNAPAADKDTKKPAEPETQPTPLRSADDEAMDALLGKRPAQEDKVIVTEDDAYARDVSAAGAASTLADYEAMPVEEFGAALLRGMGWNGQPRSNAAVKPKEAPRRRQNRLGLGAKALNEAEDLGGWNQKGNGPGGKKRPPKLADYRREEERKKEERRGGGGGGGGGRGGEDSYKREREREREDRHRDRDRGHRHGHGDRDRDGGDRDRRHRGHDRDRRR